MSLFEVTPPETAPATPAAVTWERVTTRSECVDCYADQAAASRAGEPVPHRERVRLRMTGPEGEALVCMQHGYRRGYRGSAGTGRR